ncbi:hypothetical protein GCM10010174_24210 [Kutzneria viridogrisea]|uniref:Uncharacterized protein n=1 Tax=Kutzneria viridogrisea TaxID=47990 RepID=A0ABR6BWN3_9PSEU|nr:hypothetical protein [Kutzneria viridogrisea]
MQDDAELNAHELLLRLAGRLSDDQLWRFRDWLASGALPVLCRVLPRALLHDRIGLTVQEHGQLRAIGAAPGLASSVLGLDEVPAHRYTFSSESPDQAVTGDSVGVVLGATLRNRVGVGDVRCSWRHAVGEPSRRVVLASATADHHRLTGEVQRMLRALGEHDPCVEVLPQGFELTPYHLAALDVSDLLCTGAADLVHS